jgi:tyrosyl-tRNA synthetase
MPDVAEQLRILTDGTEQVLPPDELERKLARVVAGERPPLRAKLGVDPTSPDIHIGHAVPLGKLRTFQELGHTAVLIIGGFTARVGDPSGRTTTRPPLTDEQVRANAATYVEQARKVLLPEPLEVVDNADWLAPLSMEDVLRLASRLTVAQLLQREDFATRYREGRPITLSEFLYPLLQGQDSVAIRADVELGGTDQTFNLLVGRDLQVAAGQEPQVVMTLPLLEGTDGVEKMSKSLGNAIGVDDEPFEMFGKAMSIPDELIVTYLRLATPVPVAHADRVETGLADASLHPNDAKRAMARELVSLYHSPEAAASAEERFNTQFRHRGIPDDIGEFALGDTDPWFLPSLLQAALGVASGSEARRLIRSGAVRLDGDVCTDEGAHVAAADLDGRVLQAGRRRFARLIRS